VQPLTPHKALNLPGKGRGERGSTKTANYQTKIIIAILAQITKLNPNNKTRYKYYCIVCIYQVLPLQESKHNMAATSSRKVARNLELEEEEFMEIDTSHGAIQKRATGRARDSAEKSSKKKSKNDEVLYIITPDQVERKYWLGFSYMELLAAEA
jgi:hypothetical protein